MFYPVPVWGLSRYYSFLLQSKYMHVNLGLTGDSKLPIGVNIVYLSMSAL